MRQGLRSKHAKSALALASGIEARLVADLYEQAPTVILGGVLLLLINGAYYWSVMPAVPLYLWLAGMTLATGGRGLSYFFYRRKGAPQSSRALHRHILLWSALLGGSWGVLGIGAVLMLEPTEAVVAIVSVAGVCGSATATSSASPLVFRAVAFLALVPLAVVMLFSSISAYLFIGLLTVSYLLVLSRASARIHQTLRESVTFWLKNEDLVQTLAYQSTVDSLTGISNRRALNEGFQDIWARALKDQQTVGLVLCDIDHFKAYNDHYGHLEGDSCLRRIAQALNAATRSSDLITARYGGEEFAVLIPNCDAQLLEQISERLRLAVHAIQIPHGVKGAGDHVTISVGASRLLPSDELPVDDLIRAADRALYQAKADGRNRVQVDHGLAAMVTV